MEIAICGVDGFLCRARAKRSQERLQVLRSEVQPVRGYNSCAAAGSRLISDIPGLDQAENRKVVDLIL